MSLDSDSQPKPIPDHVLRQVQLENIRHLQVGGVTDGIGPNVAHDLGIRGIETTDDAQVERELTEAFVEPTDGPLVETRATPSPLAGARAALEAARPSGYRPPKEIPGTLDHTIERRKRNLFGKKD